MERLDKDMNIAWHRAINEYHTQNKLHGEGWKYWMYDAKHLADEVGRIAIWFMYERTGQLPTIHKQCSHSEAEAIPNNHLSCALGVNCKECPFLLALEKAETIPEKLDEIKAWTCATHIIHEKAIHPNSFDDSEGYIKHEGDKMYWSNVFESLSQAVPDFPDSDEFPTDEQGNPVDEDGNLLHN